MSRIGKQHITLPDQTTLTVQAEALLVNGPKGALEVPRFPGVKVEQKENHLVITSDDLAQRAYYGLQRTLLQNAVTGVSTGWKRDLELQGVGMRAAVTGNGLTLNLGFSHPVTVESPEGITFQVTKNVISISGIDKQLVGETAAKIRKLREPEPYKGKGIRYSDELVRRKAGKTGKTK